MGSNHRYIGLGLWAFNHQKLPKIVGFLGDENGPSVTHCHALLEDSPFIDGI